MTLDNPFPVFVILADNKIDNNNITSSWVYAKDITNPQGSASGQTDANGRTAVELMDVATNGDIIQVYDDTFEYEFVLDISGLIPRIYAYQNAKLPGDIHSSNYYYDNELYLHTDNYVKKDINLKTSDY
jgi:hypothetical protein